MADGSTNVPGVPSALFAKHTTNKENPHDVTKDQVGLGNVDNTSDKEKPVSTAQAEAIADAKKAGTDAQNSLEQHINDKNNPHGADPLGAADAALKEAKEYVDEKILDISVETATVEEVKAFLALGYEGEDYNTILATVAEVQAYLNI